MKRAVLIVSLLIAAAADAQEHPCRSVSGATYWMRERYSGIDAERDAGEERQWVPNGATDRCFRTALREIESRETRTWGYRLAIEEWGKSLPWEAQRWNEPRVVALREKIAALLGREFTSVDELDAWWRQNADYLAWSDAAARLVVDDEAKRAQRPVTSHDRERTIGAAIYWAVDARGRIRNQVDDGTSIRGVAWSGDSHAGEIRFRVAKAELADRAAKELAWKHAAGELVELLGMRQLGADSAARIQHDLARITGRSFPDARSWAAWWAAHGSNARLDAQGLRLITE